MPGTIVVGTDLSPASRAAAEAAVSIAKDMDAKIVLVHAFAHIPGPIMAARLYSDEITEIESELDMAAAEDLTTDWAAAIRDQGLDVETVAGKRRPAKMILEAADEHDAAFIVVGRSGMGVLKRVLIGSVAEEVVSKSARPVLVVPSDATA